MACRYLTDQLSKVQSVNEANKGFVVEALRSIAELVTYGDQHDPSIFEFFMEKQIMGEFVRVLEAGRNLTVSLQLLQTLSIMIQNVRHEHAIYYIFSNEHINCLITHSFDFENEEVLSHYISFLRAISVKLDKSTISLLVKTENVEVVSFPLYIEAVRFAFHEENMVRIAVRALTLNIYHVGDVTVNRFVARSPQADYFSNLVIFLKMQFIKLNDIAQDGQMNAERGVSVMDEIEDNLYYFNDVISAGNLDVGKLIVDSMLQILIFPLLLPSLSRKAVHEKRVGSTTAFYLLSCILRLVKIKDLANSITAALFYSLEAFPPSPRAEHNGSLNRTDYRGQNELLHDDGVPCALAAPGRVPVSVSKMALHQEELSLTLRDSLLSYIAVGDGVHVLGSLTILSTLLHTKELDESLLDAVGILPQRRQHTKRLFRALVGESSGEERLFSFSEESASMMDELQVYHQQLKVQYGVGSSSSGVGVSPPGASHRFQVIDSLISLLSRSEIPSEILLDGAWLLHQLLPYSIAEFSQHMDLLKDPFNRRVSDVTLEARGGIWADALIPAICSEWSKCKRAMEATSLQKEARCVMLLQQQQSVDGSSSSSYAAAERMCGTVKAFVLLLQSRLLMLGTSPLADHPPLDSSPSEGPKIGDDMSLANSVPCRVAFERGKERNLHFLAVSTGFSGWLLLAEQRPTRLTCGVVRLTAPLSGSHAEIDPRHPSWLHLRIRPWSLPFSDQSRWKGRKTTARVDGRWTLGFRDEERCRSALSLVLQQTALQADHILTRLSPMLHMSS